jgi:hypothetical protein
MFMTKKHHIYYFTKITINFAIVKGLDRLKFSIAHFIESISIFVRLALFSRISRGLFLLF